jgi:hypothetical protein
VGTREMITRYMAEFLNTSMLSRGRMDPPSRSSLLKKSSSVRWMGSVRPIRSIWMQWSSLSTSVEKGKKRQPTVEEHSNPMHPHLHQGHNRKLHRHSLAYAEYSHQHRYDIRHLALPLALHHQPIVGVQDHLRLTHRGERIVTLWFC